mmetsp:Transcript_80192/g.225089  ORF Transcript_80192/g.225089 Transcript_80192/m.225089 type:complete len:202 (+) Transcript_80192:124-729(+)
MFFLCCSARNDEGDQLSFGGTMDEKTAYSAQAPPTLLAGQPGEAQRARLEAKGPPHRGADETDCTACVEDFAPVAIAGRPCVHFVEDTGKRSDARYRIDVQLRRLVVSLPSGAGPSEIACSISSIEDIYTIADGRECFPTEVLASTQPEELEGLFLVVFTVEPCPDARTLCLMEASAAARDRVLELLKLVSMSDSRQPWQL